MFEADFFYVWGWCLRLTFEAVVRDWCLRLMFEVDVWGWCLRLSDVCLGLTYEACIHGWRLRLMFWGLCLGSGGLMSTAQNRCSHGLYPRLMSEGDVCGWCQSRMSETDTYKLMIIYICTYTRITFTVCLNSYYWNGAGYSATYFPYLWIFPGHKSS